MKISFVFIFLAALIILCGVIALVEEQPSGAKQGVYLFASLFVVAASYNKWRNGKWLSDFTRS